MTSLIIHAVLGVGTTAFVLWCNRRLYTGGWAGSRVSPLELVLYLLAFVSLGLGWFFNIQYVAEFGARANAILFPIWTIVDGRRRGIRAPWGFFVMSLFTSFAFSMAAYLAVVERQVRYTRAFPEPAEPVRAPDPTASSTA